MKFYLCTVLCLLSCLCFAQADSTYVQPYKNKLSVKAYTAFNGLSLDRETGNKATSKTYTPNSPMVLGVGVSVNNTIINLSLGQALHFLTDAKRGNTKAFDFQVHNYGRKFIIDLFLQQYKGFYTADDNDKNIQLYPDLDITQYGANIQYVFNNKKFSYKAAFNQTERQLKSAGSWLIGSGVYYTNVASDSSFVYRDRNLLRSYQIGANGGYAYLWAISNRWFATGSSTIGINVGTESLDKIRMKIYPTIFPRFAFGYNKEKWSLGLTYVNNIIFSSISGDSNNTIGTMASSLQFTYTLRLDEIPFFDRKRP